MPVSSFNLSTLSLDAGQTITANINRAEASYTHTVTFAFGSASQQYTGVATSQAFTIPLSWINQIPNSTSGTASCTVQTYSGGTLMGTAPVQYFTITVPASVKPTLTSLTAVLVSGYWGLYVQGYSKATLTANGAAGTYGSTITGYSIAGGTSNPFTTGVLYTAGTNTFYATVTDSRGRTSDAVSCSITVTAYAAPVITGVLVQRASSTLGTLADEGTYNKCTLSYTWSAIGSNARTTAVDYKETTASTWTSGSIALIASGGYVVLGSGTTFAIDKSYDIRFTVDDSISNPVYAYAVLQTAKYVMDFKVGGTGVCFGGVSTRDNAVEVSPSWELYYKSQTLDNRFLRADTAFNIQWVNGPLYFKSYNGIRARHIDGGSDGYGGDLYLNYNSPAAPINLGNAGYSITNNGAYYNGAAATLIGMSSANEVVGYRGWDANPGKNADAAGSGINFTYANNAPHIGPLVTFSPGGYSLQFNAAYNDAGGVLSFRARNGDAAAYNPWRMIYHTGNIQHGTSVPSLASGCIFLKHS